MSRYIQSPELNNKFQQMGLIPLKQERVRENVWKYGPFDVGDLLELENAKILWHKEFKTDDDLNLHIYEQSHELLRRWWDGDLEDWLSEHFDK